MNTEYWELRALSRNYEDAKKMAVRLNNRIEAAKNRDLVISAGLASQLVAAKEAQKHIEQEMVRRYRKLAPPAILRFQKDTDGIGESLMAQLIGVVGDFRTYTEAWWETTGDDSSQTTSDSQASGEKRILVEGDTVTCGVRDIYSYCGHGDASRRHRKGQTQDDALAAGNPQAKMLIHLMADFAVRYNGVPDKNGRIRAMTPYYPWFIKWKDAAAAAYPEWTKGHVHNHALRKVAKAILKDIWRVQHSQEPAYGAPTPWTPRA